MVLLRYFECGDCLSAWQICVKREWRPGYHNPREGFYEKVSTFKRGRTLRVAL